MPGSVEPGWRWNSTLAPVLLVSAEGRDLGLWVQILLVLECGEKVEGLWGQVRVVRVCVCV